MASTASGIEPGGSPPAALPASDRSVMRAAWYGLAVLLTAMIFSLVNLYMIYVLAEPFKHDLGLTDTQVGAINGIALGLASALATFPMGWLADKVDRKILLGICVLAWSAATAASGFSQTYNQLFLAVVGIAVGEAVLGPIIYSIIPDLFPEHRRVLANYVFFVCSILGASAGLALSGAAVAFIEAYRGAMTFIPADFDSWRVAMIASAIPGPFVFLLILTMRLKRAAPRRAAEGSEGAGATSVLAYFARNPRSLFGVFIGFGLSYSAKTMMFVWAPPALIRVFGEGTAAAGIRLGAITAVSSVAGVLASGLAYRRLHPRLGSLAAPRIAQFGMWVAVAASLLLLLPRTAIEAYVVLALFSAAGAVALSLSPTVLQEIAPPDARGRVIALGGMCGVMFAAATPLLVGVVSDLLPQTGHSLIVAMVSVGAPCLALGALIIRFGEKTLPATIADAAS